MTARPFLKWAGGKSQLLPELVKRSPSRIATYYEPFLGGAALFFALRADPERAPRRAVLNDLNQDLITTYEVVRDTPELLEKRLTVLARRYLSSAPDGRDAMYYHVRSQSPKREVEIAARLIFLNKTCYNGLFRVNRKGEFNVPHGRYKTPRILDPETIRAASEALHGVALVRSDFASACESATPEDFVYFDPPFHPLSATSSFTGYTGVDFGEPDQLRLRKTIDALTMQGVPVLMSNSPHPWIRDLYERAGYRIEEIPARRAINSRAEKRGPISEMLVSNQPLLFRLEDEVQAEPVL